MLCETVKYVLLTKVSSFQNNRFHCSLIPIPNVRYGNKTKIIPTHVCQVRLVWAHDIGREEDSKRKERHPVSDSLESFVCTRYAGEVEPSEEVPVHDVFDVELDGCHDNPEHIPGEGCGES